MMRHAPLSTLFPYTTLFRSTGATAPLELYERLAELAARWDFALASDEAYSELWFDEPPVSALQAPDRSQVDRKSTRLNSSHTVISYAVFCLKKKTQISEASI